MFAPRIAKPRFVLTTSSFMLLLCTIVLARPAEAQSSAATGSGTAGRLAKWTSGTALGNSIVRESSGRIGIGIAPGTSKLEIGAQDGLKIKGYQPFLTLTDTNAANKRSIIQGVNGDFHFYPNSFIGGNPLMSIFDYGKIGIGTTSPNARLHVESSGTAVIGGSTIGSGVAGSSTNGWGVFGQSVNDYAGYFAGDVRVTGTINPSSDRADKADFQLVDGRAILDKLVGLSVQTWIYKADRRAARHIGPTSQEFAAAFGVGTDDKSIATVDADGVALAAIQGLYQVLQEKDRQIAELSREVAALQAQFSTTR